ncbi:MAG TPA: metal ABC transporter permease [Planctomycetes bacterium]|nr:metal ABC transporter permease [Planctomycetota bacterium]
MPGSFALLRDLYLDAFLGSLLAAFLCSMVGVLLYLRRNVFLGLALPQAAAAGISLDLVLLPWWFGAVGWGVVKSGDHLHPSFALHTVFAFWAVLLVLGVLTRMERSRRGSPESRTAAAYVVSLAATILLLQNTPFGRAFVDSMVRGEILSISQADLLLLLVLTLFTFGTLHLFRGRILLVLFDREAATASGIRPHVWEGLVLLLAGLAVAAGVVTVGPLVVFSYFALPPLAARGLSPSMRSFMILSVAFGLASTLGGWAFSLATDHPLGPSIAAAGFALLLITRALRPLASRVVPPAP